MRRLLILLLILAGNRTAWAQAASQPAAAKPPTLDEAKASLRREARARGVTVDR